jgi:hypothetical protein
MRRIYITIGALLIAGAFWRPAEGQRATVSNLAGESLTPRHLARGTLWHSFLSTGAEGARPVEGNYAGLYLDLAYPGFALISWGGGGTNDFSSYYGDQRSAGSMHVDLTSHNGRGHGWWIATKVNGQAEVSWADPLIAAMEESEDVVAMAVDPGVDFKGRYAGLGNDVVSPNSGRSMANWWPGTGVELDALEPREILNYRIGQYNDVSVDNFPEDIVLSKWTTGLGITGEKAAFAWNHPDYDDFVITEWVFENTGDTDGDRAADLPGGGHALENVYFSFHHRFMPSSSGVSRTSYRAYYSDYGTGDGCSSNFGPLDNSQDDKIKYTESPNYDGPGTARGLRLTYQYDWDNFCLTGPLADDIGDPYRSELRCSQCTFPSLTRVGDITSPAWIGKAPIDVDPTDGFVGDNDVYEAPKVAQQPFAHNLFHFFHRQQSIAVLFELLTEEPDPNVHTDDTLYQMISSSPDPSYFEPLNDHNAALSRSTRGSGDPNLGVPLLPLPDNPTEPMPYMPNPEWEWKDRHGIAAAYSVMDAYGPYDLAPGQKVKLVFAYVAGAPVTENFKTFQKRRDNTELRKEENGLAWANLVNHLMKAKEAYALGYDLPNQPPDVDARLASSANAQVEITWPATGDNAINPDTDQSDVAGYRVYRSEGLPDQWELVADIKVGSASGGTYLYEDSNSVAGFPYYYSVRSYQGSANTGFVSRVTGETVAGGVSAYESGPGDPSTFYYPPSGPVSFSPVQSVSASADRLEKDILIVPNPYILDDMHTYEGSTKIRILNVPRKCKIRIYTVGGDLVGEVLHDSQTVGEAAYFQLNRTSTSPLVFGTYFVTVESMVQESMGQVKRAAFVTIR